MTIKGDYFYTDFNGSEFYPPGIILCKIELAREKKRLFAGRAEFENISVLRNIISTQLERLSTVCIDECVI